MNFELKKHVIGLVKAGSHAYGISTPESDLDIKGIAIPPVSCILGMEIFESSDADSEMEKLKSLMDTATLDKTKNGLEGVVFELRKFILLAERCNANVLDLLFGREEDIIFQNKFFKKLRDNRHLFITANAHNSFAGYGAGQLKKLTRQKETPNPNSVRYPIEQKYGWDTKFGSHAIRLLRMCKEILLEGEVKIFRPDADELLAIRHGAWTYDELLDYSNSMLKEIDDVMANKKFVIPAYPDRQKINKLSEEILREWLLAN